MSMTSLNYKLLLIIMLPALALIAGDDRTYGNARLSSVIRVYDGDTFYGKVNSWPAILGDTIGIRIYGIDTPEMKGVPDSVKVLSLKAKELTEKFLMSGKRVTLKNMRRDKYFRILADVYVGSISIGDTLVKAGLAKPYFGGTKDSWSTTHD